MKFRNRNQSTFGTSCLREYALLVRDIRPGDHVLDLGAHVGSFSVRAAELGANVRSYEPDPDNYALLVENTVGLAVQANQLAVTADGRDVQLYRTNTPLEVSANAGQSVLPGRRTHVSDTLRSVSFQSVLEAGPVDLLKVDVEGAELEYDWSLIPRSVRFLAVEFHACHCERAYGNRDTLVSSVERLLATGFTCSKRLDPRNWDGWLQRSFVLRRL